MARSTTSARKQKTFPALDAPVPKPAVTRLDASSEEESSDNDSDAPEAVTLSGGRAAADAREVAMNEHQQKMKEQRKAKNKAREEFIQSTKSKTLPVASEDQDGDEEDEEDEEEQDEDGSQSEEEGAGDPVLQARMARAMQDAEDEDEEEDEESSEEDEEEPIPQAPRPSNRLPDAIFAAAAAANQSTERKRAKKASKQEVQVKRRRIREAPVEHVVNGRTLRVTTPLDAPPSLPSSTRKLNKNTKGGSAFRRKWKKLDALRSQTRSRSGPARNFVTSVQ